MKTPKAINSVQKKMAVPLRLTDAIKNSNSHLHEGRFACHCIIFGIHMQSYLLANNGPVALWSRFSLKIPLIRILKVTTADLTHRLHRKKKMGRHTRCRFILTPPKGLPVKSIFSLWSHDHDFFPLLLHLLSYGSAPFNVMALQLPPLFNVNVCTSVY